MLACAAASHRVQLWWGCLIRWWRTPASLSRAQDCYLEMTCPYQEVWNLPDNEKENILRKESFCCNKNYSERLVQLCMTMGVDGDGSVNTEGSAQEYLAFAAFHQPAGINFICCSFCYHKTGEVDPENLLCEMPWNTSNSDKSMNSHDLTLLHLPKLTSKHFKSVMLYA